MDGAGSAPGTPVPRGACNSDSKGGAGSAPCTLVHRGAGITTLPAGAHIAVSHCGEGAGIASWGVSEAARARRGGDSQEGGSANAACCANGAAGEG